MQLSRVTLDDSNRLKEDPIIHINIIIHIKHIDIIIHIKYLYV